MWLLAAFHVTTGLPFSPLAVYVGWLAGVACDAWRAFGVLSRHSATDPPLKVKVDTSSASCQISRSARTYCGVHGKIEPPPTRRDSPRPRPKFIGGMVYLMQRKRVAFGECKLTGLQLAGAAFDKLRKLGKRDDADEAAIAPDVDAVRQDRPSDHAATFARCTSPFDRCNVMACNCARAV